MKRWTRDDMDKLKEYYPTNGGRYCADLLDRSYKAVCEKARELKIRTHIIHGNILEGWTQAEEAVLIEYYPDYGYRYCINLLNRSPRSIYHRANKLGLTTVMSPWGAPQKQIIKKLEGNKVITLCKKHGETPHYLQQGRISGCILCQSSQMKMIHQTDRMKKYYREKRKRDRTIPLSLYRIRLRSLLSGAFKRHLQIRNIKKRRGCFRLLSYSPQELCNHLEMIKGRQNNQCPVCSRSYNIIGINIDHIIPLATAQTEAEMLELFDLDNLSLLCGSCNRSKGARTLTPDKMERMRANGY